MDLTKEAPASACSAQRRTLTTLTDSRTCGLNRHLGDTVSGIPRGPRPLRAQSGVGGKGCNLCLKGCTTRPQGVQSDRCWEICVKQHLSAGPCRAGVSVSVSRGWTRSCPVTPTARPTSKFHLQTPWPPTPTWPLDPQLAHCYASYASQSGGGVCSGCALIFFFPLFFDDTDYASCLDYTLGARNSDCEPSGSGRRTCVSVGPDVVVLVFYWCRRKEVVEEEAGVPGSTYSSRYVFTSLPGWRLLPLRLLHPPIPEILQALGLGLILARRVFGGAALITSVGPRATSAVGAVSVVTSASRPNFVSGMLHQGIREKSPPPQKKEKRALEFSFTRGQPWSAPYDIAMSKLHEDPWGGWRAIWENPSPSVPQPPPCFFAL